MLDQMDTLKKIWGWLRSLFTLWARVATLDKRVTELESQMGKVEKAAPPKPRDPKPSHGIYWGIPEGGDRRHAYCAACARKGEWVPLTMNKLRGDPTARSCPACKATFPRLSREEEAKAQEP